MIQTKVRFAQVFEFKEKLYRGKVWSQSSRIKIHNCDDFIVEDKEAAIEVDDLKEVVCAGQIFKDSFEASKETLDQKEAKVEEHFQENLGKEIEKNFC